MVIAPRMMTTRSILCCVLLTCFGLVFISLTVQIGQIYRRRRHVSMLPNRRSRTWKHNDDSIEDIAFFDWSSLFQPTEAWRHDTVDHIGSEAFQQTGFHGNQPFMTLFTTLTNRNSLTRAYNNTIQNWAALRPYVTPVLFFADTTDKHLIQNAVAHGWKTTLVVQTNRGMPTLQYMFSEAMKLTRTEFYGYSAANTLFDSTLIGNLQSFLSNGDQFKNLVIIGNTAAINMSELGLYHVDLLNLTKPQRFVNKRHESLRANMKGCFIITCSNFPWREFPEEVVSNEDFDKWVVMKAQDWNLTVVDASYMINALYQGFEENR